MKINCLRVEVYRSPFGDCSNHGVSSRFRSLLLYCPDGPDSFDSESETPLNFCFIRHHDYPFARTCEIVPACVLESGKVVARPHHYMFGGNIGYTSDSRFSYLAGHYYPLKIHDRRE